MGTHCLVVYSSPTAAEREAEYNEWYVGQHIPDVLKVPGFIAAQRFKLPSNDAAAPGRYLALYEMETANPDGALAELMKRVGTPEMVMSDAMDMSSAELILTTAVSNRITGKGAT